MNAISFSFLAADIPSGLSGTLILEFDLVPPPESASPSPSAKVPTISPYRRAILGSPIRIPSMPTARRLNAYAPTYFGRRFKSFGGVGGQRSVGPRTHLQRCGRTFFDTAVMERMSISPAMSPVSRRQSWRSGYLLWTSVDGRSGPRIIRRKGVGAVTPIA